MKKLILMLMLMAPVCTFAQKFGHINSQEIMSQMPEFIKARGDIEAQAKQYENELKSMQDELTRKGEEYEKGKSTMNATAQQQKEEELQQLYQKIQQAYQDNQQELNKKQQELMQPITTKLLNAIKTVGDKGGYVYIMDLSMGVPYISTTLSKDVTAEVKAQLQ